MSLELSTVRPPAPARLRLGSALVAALPLLTLTACSAISTDGWGYSYAIVYGTVTNGGGAPVANAIVRVSLHLQDCAEGALTYQDASTASGGRYRVLATLPAIREATVCPSVAVTPPSGSGLSPRTVTGSTVVTRTPATAADSVRIDVPLQP